LELILAGSIQCIVCSEYLPKAGLTELFFPIDILRADLPLLLLPFDWVSLSELISVAVAGQSEIGLIWTPASSLDIMRFKSILSFFYILLRASLILFGLSFVFFLLNELGLVRERLVELQPFLTSLTLSWSPPASEL